MLPCPLQHLYLCAAWLGAPCLQREAFTIMCEEGGFLFISPSCCVRAVRQNLIPSRFLDLRR